MVKKIMLILTLVIGLFMLSLFNSTALCTFDIDGKYTLYTVNRDQPYIYADGSNAEELYLSCDTVAGECWSFNGLEKLWDMIDELDAEVVAKEYIGDVAIVYCFSDRLNSYYISDGKKINLQIAIYENDDVKIGYPLILDGY